MVTFKCGFFNEPVYTCELIIYPRRVDFDESVGELNTVFYMINVHLNHGRTIRICRKLTAKFLSGGRSTPHRLIRPFRRHLSHVEVTTFREIHKISDVLVFLLR